MIVSGAQQNDTAIHIHVSILPQTPLPSRLPHNIEQNWQTTLCKFKVYNMMFWCIYIYGEMITTRWVNISIIPHSYHFFCLVRIFKIYYLNNFSSISTVLLTIVTMLYITSPELIYHLTKSLHPLYNIYFPHPWALETTSLLSEPTSLTFLDCAYE